MIFYRRFPGDYARDTADLTLEQHGAYNLGLDIYYATEKPLPLNKPLLYRMVRAESRSERAAVDSVIKRFFTKTRSGYVHKRVLEEIEYAKSRAEAARQNGKLGGRPRKKGNPMGFAEKPSRNPVGFAEKPSRVPSKNPEHNPEKSYTDSRLQTSDEKSKSSCPPSADEVNAAASQLSPSEPAVSIPAMELAVLLRQRRLENNPKAKITERQVCEWGREADLMLRQDHRTPEEISALIEWSQRDSFWKTNILSMKSLRKHFDQLALKRNSEKDGSEPAWRSRERAAEEKQRESWRVISKLAKEGVS